MKIRYALLTAVAVSAAATTKNLPAQTAATTATETAQKVVVKQSHFDARVEQIRKDIAALPPTTTGTIVMVGDSITEGFFRKEAMPETVNGMLVVNQGISGDQIDRPSAGTGLTSRIDLIKQARPAVVFVMIGVNDFWGGKETPEEVLPQYENMFTMLKQALPETQIVLQSVLPTSKKNAYLNENVDKLNALAKELAEKSGTIYLDLHPTMEDEKGELKDEFTGDGVHLTPAGYAAWLQKLQEVGFIIFTKN